jgi:hypothetical protein
MTMAASTRWTIRKEKNKIEATVLKRDIDFSPFADVTAFIQYVSAYIS